MCERWILVEVVHGGHDAILEFLFGGDADVAEDGAGELGKKPSTRLSRALVPLEMWAE
jgi:hypothetical protein